MTPPSRSHFNQRPRAPRPRAATVPQPGAAAAKELPVPTYRCVTCDRSVQWSGPLPELYPFCSRRCKLVDLGRWLHEDHGTEYHPKPGELPEPLPPATPDEPR